MQKLKGFTLIELLAVLTIASILLGLGLPAMESMLGRNAVAATSNDIIAQLNWARSQAALTGHRVALCRSGSAMSPGLPQCDRGASGDPAHDGYEDGWLLFNDDDQDWQPNQMSDILRRSEAIPYDSVTIRGQSKGDNADHIGFTHLGLAAGTAGSLVVCNGSGWINNGAQATVIIVSPDGRIRSSPGNSPGLSVSSCTP